MNSRVGHILVSNYYRLVFQSKFGDAFSPFFNRYAHTTSNLREFSVFGVAIRDLDDKTVISCLHTVGYRDNKIAFLLHTAWWHHQMETFSVILALCAGNSPVTDDFLSQRPVTRSFDVLLDLNLNKRLSKQSRRWWFDTTSYPLWRHCNGQRAFSGWYWDNIMGYFFIVTVELYKLMCYNGSCYWKTLMCIDHNVHYAGTNLTFIDLYHHQIGTWPSAKAMLTVISMTRKMSHKTHFAIRPLKKLYSTQVGGEDRQPIGFFIL